MNTCILYIVSNNAHPTPTRLWFCQYVLNLKEVLKITNHFQIHRNKTSMVSMMSGSVILREPNKSNKDFSDTHLDVMGIGRIRIYQKILWLCQRSWSCLNDGIKSEDVHSERAYGVQLKGAVEQCALLPPPHPSF